ncbi:DUF1450 domain-containing protein [Effusibacillus lacus]|uniref:DUF1450 domain-containing protein n=1 Tax=Effusibacillus lacus TaxID=1348429 RepID=UPI000BB6963B|nr:DUF1450 domain-containing protein [Effusibacillus lacus]TCS76264.1 uncharacterized protein YuzB (UPF0349 family) [Effusibacillus lacus]
MSLLSSLSLKFCKKNLELYSQSVYDALKERYPNEKIEVVDCVGKEYCGTCTDVPFAIRNNALVGGRTARDLFYKFERGMVFLDNLPEPEAAAEEKKPVEKPDAVEAKGSK